MLINHHHYHHHHHCRHDGHHPSMGTMMGKSFYTQTINVFVVSWWRASRTIRKQQLDASATFIMFKKKVIVKLKHTHHTHTHTKYKLGLFWRN